jgi:acyl carrier protein
VDRESRSVSEGELRSADLEQLIRDALARRVGDEVVAGLASDEDLFAAGIASIDIVMALSQLERELDVDADRPLPLADFPTISATVAYLEGNARRRSVRSVG